ncbi:glycosyltransferase involved in cell wall biosynthesis [Brevibacterium pityocampae]
MRTRTPTIGTMMMSISMPGRSDVPTPQLSIIIPAKDGAPYLATMFRSLHQQSLDLDTVQVIFVDDGSTDETPELLAEFGPAFPDFTVITNDTAVGLANGRNQALGIAAGEHIAFLDGDDWLFPDHLSTTLAAIRALDVDFVRCDHVQVTGSHRELRRAPMAVRNCALSPRAGILPIHDSTMVDYPFAWAGMFHRRLLDAGLLQFPADFMTAEDRSWIWNLHLNARSFAVIDAPGIGYRRGLASSLSQVLDARQLYFIEAFERIFALVERDPESTRFMPKAVRNWLAILHHQSERFAGTESELTRRITAGSRRVSAALPWPVLKDQFLSSRRERRLAVFQFMPHRQELVKEFVR